MSSPGCQSSPFPPGMRKVTNARRRRAERAAAEAPFAPGVAKIIDELIAAVAVTAATTAAS